MSVIEGCSSKVSLHYREKKEVTGGQIRTCMVDDSKAQTLVGLQRSGLLLLDETGRYHGEISQMVGVRSSFCALLA